MLQKANADSEYTWRAIRDRQETCYIGATQMPNGEWVSDQEHITYKEMKAAQ
jgi:hypothetical protein